GRARVPGGAPREKQRECVARGALIRDPSKLSPEASRQARPSAGVILISRTRAGYLHSGCALTASLALASCANGRWDATAGGAHPATDAQVSTPESDAPSTRLLPDEPRA